jgi:glutamate synthase (NADPH/NADH) large chain
MFAGTSGGTAYVLDLDRALINPAAAAAGDLLIDELDNDDLAVVVPLLERHLELTGSAVAERLLSDRAALPTRITRVLHRQYAAVSAALTRATEAGLDAAAPQVWTEIMEATRG